MRAFVLFILFSISTLVKGQQTLFYFSGSDWCRPCIKFEKNVIQTPQFKEFSEKFLDFEKVDFPQKTKGITKSELARRDSLAELYNKEGKFPRFILLGDDGFKVINHIGKDVDSFIQEISKHFEKKDPTKIRAEIRMGSRFEIRLCDADSFHMVQAYREIENLEMLISSWEKYSQTSRINRAAGIEPVRVTGSFIDVLEKLIKMSEATQGAFDITIGPAVDAWNWKKGIVPSKEKIDSLKELVNYKNIKIDRKRLTVYLEKKGMKIDLGGIGKGLAALEVKEYMWKAKLSNGVVNAGGDIYVKGTNCEGKPWDIGIRNPFKENELVYTLKETDRAIATSGDYERYFMSGPKRYSHIIDPRTCEPIQGMSSVTVICEDPVIADVLATTLSVLGVEAGIDLVDQLPGTDAIFITSDGNVTTSKGIVLNE